MAKKKVAKKKESPKKNHKRMVQAKGAEAGVGTYLTKPAPNAFQITFEFGDYEYVAFPHFFKELALFAKEVGKGASKMEKQYQETLAAIKATGHTPDCPSAPKAH